MRAKLTSKEKRIKRYRRKHKERKRVVAGLNKTPLKALSHQVDLLADVITESLQYDYSKINLFKNVYVFMADLHEISISGFEKELKDTLITSMIEGLKSDDLVFPSPLIKEAFMSAKPKRFITAVCYYLKN